MRIHRLSARQVETVKKDGVYSDGAGLYLRVRGAARSWLFVFQWQGRRREMGLGAPPAISLARARDRAQSARETLADGRDPIAERNSERARPTFAVVADEWREARRGSVRSQKSIDRWARMLGPGGYTDALRSERIDRITTEHVLAVLKPIWSMGQTGTATRGYLEQVIDAAGARKLRSGENPARWKGHLEHLLPRPQKLTRGHHAAMPYSDLPTFMSELRGREGTVARALELTILTAARSGEVFGATWGEMDAERGLWTLPGGRMKAGKSHTVPLVGRALEIVRNLPGGTDCQYLFPGQREGRPLSNMAMEMLMRRMGYGDTVNKRTGEIIKGSHPNYTVHGFRSAFRDFAGDCTDHSEEIAEGALAHTVGSSVRRAYRRGEALEKRRALMADWEAYCGGKTPDAAANANEQRAAANDADAA